MNIFMVSGILIFATTLGIFPNTISEERCATLEGELLVDVPKTVAFPNIAGKILPRPNSPVYIIPLKGKFPIQELIDSLEESEKKFNENPNSPEELFNAGELLAKVDKIVQSPSIATSTRTDKDGKFVFKNLQAGEKYVLIAIKLSKGGYLEIHTIVGPLKPGKNTVRLVMDY